MIIQHSSDYRFASVINDSEIKQVKEFRNLGHKLFATNEETADLRWVVIEKNKLLLTSTRIPYHMKTKHRCHKE